MTFFSGIVWTLCNVTCEQEGRLVFQSGMADLKFIRRNILSYRIYCSFKMQCTSDAVTQFRKTFFLVTLCVTALWTGSVFLLVCKHIFVINLDEICRRIIR